MQQKRRGESAVAYRDENRSKGTSIYYYIEQFSFIYLFLCTYFVIRVGICDIVCCELCVFRIESVRVSVNLLCLPCAIIMCCVIRLIFSRFRELRGDIMFAARIIIFNLEIICYKLCIHGLTEASFILQFYCGGGRAFVQKLCIQTF